MDEFEKAERLRQRANVSFEEARDALKACDGDMLDAMVYLEKQGFTNAPQQTNFSTGAGEQKDYQDVPQVIRRNTTEDERSFGERLGDLLNTAFHKGTTNHLVISHHKKEVMRLPLLVVVILFLVTNAAMVIGVVISLFFDVRYSFVGKDDLSSINRMIVNFSKN